jgi:uncharacterized cupin superfamily protein
MNLEIRKAGPAERAQAEAWALWECAPSRFEWGYAQTEECLLLEGEVMVEARGREYRFGAGDFVVFPKGLACRWNVLKTVKKRYRFVP